MEHLYNDPAYKPRRTELRKDQTVAEKILWEHLRDKRLFGYRFVRQYSVGIYILDFYCPKRRVGIELDGSQHMEKEAMEYDKERTRFLNRYDVHVLRFWNNEVIGKREAVLEAILTVLKERAEGE